MLAVVAGAVCGGGDVGRAAACAVELVADNAASTAEGAGGLLVALPAASSCQ